MLHEIVMRHIICRQNGEEIAELLGEHLGTGTYQYSIKYKGYNAYHVISGEEYGRIIREARNRGYDVFDYSPIE